MRTTISVLFLWQLLVIPLFSVQTLPAITSAYAKEITVDGTADTAAGPVTVFDTSSEVETLIGRGDVSSDGKFAIIVKPALSGGHYLVAIDNLGRRSSVFTVGPARSGPTPAAPPE